MLSVALDPAQHISYAIARIPPTVWEESILAGGFWKLASTKQSFSGLGILNKWTVWG